MAVDTLASRSADDLLHDADVAMYRAKAAGKATIEEAHSGDRAAAHGVAAQGHVRRPGPTRIAEGPAGA